MRNISFLFLLAAALTACVADDSSTTGEKPGTTDHTRHAVEGLVMDEGEPAADGCGWTLMIDAIRYKPVNLPDEFKVTDRKVKVTYAELETIYRCGIAALPMPEVKILSITQD